MSVIEHSGARAHSSSIRHSVQKGAEEFRSGRKKDGDMRDGEWSGKGAYSCSWKPVVDHREKERGMRKRYTV